MGGLCAKPSTSPGPSNSTSEAHNPRRCRSDADAHSASPTSNPSEEVVVVNQRRVSLVVQTPAITLTPADNPLNAPTPRQRAISWGPDVLLLDGGANSNSVPPPSVALPLGTAMSEESSFIEAVEERSVSRKRTPQPKTKIISPRNTTQS